jgi:hypothetical protein
MFKISGDYPKTKMCDVCWIILFRKKKKKKRSTAIHSIDSSREQKKKEMDLDKWRTTLLHRWKTEYDWVYKARLIGAAIGIPLGSFMISSKRMDTIEKSFIPMVGGLAGSLFGYFWIEIMLFAGPVGLGYWLKTRLTK